MARNLTVEYNKAKCVGNGECMKADPEDFVMNLQENKAVLKGSTLKGEGAETYVLTKLYDHPDTAITAAKKCPVNAIKVVDADTYEEIVGVEVKQDETEEIVAAYDDLKEFQMDPKGYFLIRVDEEKKVIEAAFCPKPNHVKYKVTGKKPLEIYMTIIKKGIIDRADHGAYLGRELQKAYIALQKGIKYVQDDELEL
jgi:ferredoxin